MSKTLLRVVPVLATVLCMTWSARAADCNTNGISDDQDILNMTSADCNTNGTPDECDTLVITASFPSADVPKNILDSVTVNSTNTVAASGTIADVNVQVTITHTFDGDLRLVLTHLAATCTLTSANGSSGDNYTGTVFDDQAGTAIASGAAPFAGTFRPTTVLSVFNSLNETGLWNLATADTAGGDTGTLLSWALFIRTAPAVADCNSDGTPDACQLVGRDCNTNGTLDLCDTAGGAGDCNTDRTPDVCELVGNDCNSNGSLDVCERNSNGTASEAYGNSNTQLIPDNNTITGALTSVNVPTSRTVVDVNVQVNIAHTLASDLRLTVTHSSTTVTFVSNRGTTGAGGFSNTVFDDQAVNAITNTTFVAPFAGTFKPSGTLSSFNGLSEHGFWNLRVFDSIATNTGTLLNWSVYLKTSTPHDCNTNGILDECDIAFGGFGDTNSDGILDICQDCNTNGTPDPAEGGSDCNTNGTPDICESGCNTNGTPDICDTFGTQAVSSSSDTPLGIPDASTVGANSVISVAATGPVKDVDVQLSVDHTANGNLTLTLTHGATTVTLASALTGAGISGLYFDQGAPVAVTGGNAPYSGTFSATPGSLNSFNNLSAAGAWTLRAADTVSGNTGTLLSWSLFLRVPSDDCNTNGTPDHCEAVFADCNTNGTMDRCEVIGGIVGFSPDCNTNLTPDVCEAALLDCNTNGTPDSCDLLTVFQQNASTNVTVNLNAATTNSSLTITGGVGFVSDVNVQVNIRHNVDSDLTIKLIQSSNTVTLAAARGGSGQNYTNTVFDDQAATAISAGAAPFSGTFRPEQALSVFNGRSKNATWTLSVTDAAAGGTGTLLSWGLFLSYEANDSANKDCNSNGIPDVCELNAGSDQNNNGRLDICEDCNSNGTPDALEPGYSDCNTDGTADFCQLTGRDCNSNGTLDVCDTIGGAGDCNTNRTPDACELSGRDCNTNGTLDLCDTIGGAGDCNTNRTPDVCETIGGLNDCNTNRTPDICERPGHDCNSNLTLDVCDIAGGASDCDSNGVPDSCQLVFGPATIVSSIPARAGFLDISTSGTAVAVDLADDNSTNVSIPFSNTFIPAGTWSMNNNGTVYFGASVNGGFTNGAVPSTTFTSSEAFYPFWDDMLTNGAAGGNGNTFYATVGSAPNRIFVVEWKNIGHYSSGTSVGQATWEVQLFENPAGGVFAQYLYSDVTFEGYSGDLSTSGLADNGQSASIGYQDSSVSGLMWAPLNSNQVTAGMVLSIFKTSPGDCNTNGTIDSCELAGHDCNTNGTLDFCDTPDCNTNHTPDACETGGDANHNGTPDVCEDCNTNGTSDSQEAGYQDCNSNGTADFCEIARGAVDCDSNGTIDLCEISGSDCNTNGTLDYCDIQHGLTDCDMNTIPDVCEIAGNDCNTNGTLDVCDIYFGGNSQDCQFDVIPDECQVVQYVAPGIFNNIPAVNGFLDISTNAGAASFSLGDDGSATGVLIPFQNALMASTNATINNNGWISLSGAPSGSSWVNTALPTPGEVQGFFPWWDDLYNTNGSPSVYVQTLGSAPNRTWVVEYLNEEDELLTRGTDQITFEMQLFETPVNGVWVQYLYRDTVVAPGTPAFDHAAAATIGIQSPSGTFTWSNNTASVNDGDVISVLATSTRAIDDCDTNGTPDECESDANADGTPDVCQDCNTNGTADIAEPGYADCNTNAIADFCEGHDCNTDGTLDLCQIGGNDCNGNGTLDICDLSGQDCNTNGIVDSCELAGGDCDNNHTLDVCEIGSHDCNTDGTLDSCELSGHDCNSNSTLDVCDLAGGAADCNSDGTLDSCELSIDCNTNGTPDACDLVPDCNTNGIPDACDLSSAIDVTSPDFPPGDTQTYVVSPAAPSIGNVTLTFTCIGDIDGAIGSGNEEDFAIDLNGTGVGFAYGAPGFAQCGTVPQVDTIVVSAATWNAAISGGSVAIHMVANVNVNTTLCSATPPDANAFLRVRVQYSKAGGDCNTNGTPDACEPDCDHDGTPDSCQTFADCDTNGIPDSCEADANSNGTPDVCEVATCQHCSGDINGDNLVDGEDVAGWVRCSLSAALPGDDCPCQNGMTLAQFIDRLLNNPTPCP